MSFRQEKPVVTRMFDRRPPIFTSRCCKLVSDRFSIRRGSVSRRHKLPNIATTLFMAMRLSQRNLLEVSVVFFSICMASELRAHALPGN
jgi:hypothetical protein